MIALIMMMCTGFIGSILAKKLKLPTLVGMLLGGLIIGRSGLNIIPEQALELTRVIREVALAIILLRAGMSINLKQLKVVGMPTLFMTCIPALCEILGVMVIATIAFSMPMVEAMMLGTILAAVSPAVLVPRMIQLIKQGVGAKKQIPSLLLAAATFDDVVVLLLFSVSLQIYKGAAVSLYTWINVPIALVGGVILGYFCAKVTCYIARYIKLAQVVYTIMLIVIAIILLKSEPYLKLYLPFSGLAATMTFSIFVKKEGHLEIKKVEGYLANIWRIFEIGLFTSVGALVMISAMNGYVLVSLILLLCGLLFRCGGVLISLLPTTFNRKEKLFCCIAYLPKATVQATIGATPLMLGVSSGALILAISIMAIIITAPIGAMGIDKLSQYLLKDAT